MHFVMFILGILCVLAGLAFLLQEKSEKTAGTACLIIGITLLVLGSDLGERVQNLKVSGTSVEMSFSPQPAALSDTQVAGAQKAQQARLAPQTAPSTGARVISLARPDAQRRYQERTAALHQALQTQGMTPAADPLLDLSPGMLVRVALDGKVTVQFRRQDAFPLLKVQSSTFDFLQFTSLVGTKTGFKEIGVFECNQGFREDIDLVRSAMVSLSAEVAMKDDPSLKVVRSVLGCYGTEELSLLTRTPGSPSTQKRYILGFQLTTAGK